MTDTAPTLLIVYNADSGLFNMAVHAVHKAVSPKTYPCSLCAVTYGPVSMHSDWKKFLNDLPNAVVFHHADDFEAAHPGYHTDLPAILTRNSCTGLQVLIDSAELDKVQDVVELIPLVRERLANLAKPKLATPGLSGAKQSNKAA